MKRDTQIKLSKLVGMLGSEHDGEILNAVSRMKELLKSEKLSIPDLQQLVLVGKVTVIINKDGTRAENQTNVHAKEAPWEGADEIHRGKANRDHSEKDNNSIVLMSRAILNNAGQKLSHTEHRFVVQMGNLAMTRPHFEMTPKQASWFADLYRKYG